VHGDAAGFLLDGKTQVHFPPHMAAAVLRAVNVGERVKIRGVKSPAIGLLIAASITSENDILVEDHGPGLKHARS
jgi:hypothetical protein